jgi:hypothetical protein
MKRMGALADSGKRAHIPTPRRIPVWAYDEIKNLRLGAEVRADDPWPPAWARP